MSATIGAIWKDNGGTETPKGSTDTGPQFWRLKGSTCELVPTLIFVLQDDIVEVLDPFSWRNKFETKSVNTEDPI